MTTPRTSRDRPAPAAKGPERPAHHERPTMPAGKVFVVMLVCLLLWAFLFAPTMKRAAEASPDGARRSAALAILTPFVAINDALRITELTDAVEQALGRDPKEAPGGEIVVPPEPIPSEPGTGGTGSGGDVHTKGPIRKPTATNKLRVVVVGDSLASGLGVYLERALKPSLVRVSRQGRISTGLARPDYFNWPAALSEIVNNFRPDLVVVMLGENDNQALRDAAGHEQTQVGTIDWPPAYGERVEDFMHLATSKGARVVWVGLPIVSETGRWGIIRRQNDVFEHGAHTVDDVAYLDTWDMFAAPDGGYTAFHRDGGTVELVRESDGLHFNATGYALLAHAVLDAAQRQFDLTPRVVAG